MSFLNFIDTTFILTLGIILLVSGGIMIYCYRRLNILENSLIQQGRVLQEFISTYNNNNFSNNTINNNNIDNNDMCTVNTALSNNITDSNKIVVSENDDSDIDSEVSDSDTDDLGESDDNDEDNNKRDFSIEKIDNDLKINLDINIDKKDITIEDITDLTNISSNDNSKIIPISDSEGNDLSKKNPNKLRVDELRELVVNKNLVNTDDAQKLKKNELLKLLE